MRVCVILGLVVAFGVAGSIVPVKATAADVQQGKNLFQGRCAMCHSTESGVNKIGPSLAGVMGRKAGTVPNFDYSQALKKSGIVWTPKTLNKWLRNPHTFIPGDRMPFPGLASKSERADIIAYLGSLGRR